MSIVAEPDFRFAGNRRTKSLQEIIGRRLTQIGKLGEKTDGNHAAF